MNLLIDSKLCVSPHRIAIDDLPAFEGPLQVFTVVVEGGDQVTIRQRRKSTRRAYRSAPPIELAEPGVLQFLPARQTTPAFVDVPTPYGLRRDYRLDGETLYSKYVSNPAA